MIEHINIRKCDICKKEMNDENGSLQFYWRPAGWLFRANGPAGILLTDICQDCSKEINNSLTETISRLQR